MRLFAKYCFLFLIVTPFLLATAQSRIDTVETFENDVELSSYDGEDFEPFAWQRSSERNFSGGYSLELHGNTWKSESISRRSVDSSTVWSVAVYIDETAEIQGFGVGDENNVLFYSFAGTEEVEFENWVTVYQGAFPENEWNVLDLPLGEDWLTEFGYLPEITRMVFVNDKDETVFGKVFFDEILDITNSINRPPDVTIEYTTGKIYSDGSAKSVDAQFYSEIYDPDSEEWQYFWDFGDGGTSDEPNPAHTFTVTDDHDFTVFLEVTDESGNYASASCKVSVDEGESSLPLTINFVGDIMLARGMQYIIDYYGIEAVFEPTLSIFGNDADISVANLECPLTNAVNAHPTKPIYFKGKPEYAEGLVYAGIDAVTVANNHIYDYLDDGLTETISVLDEAGIVNFGAGINSYFAKKPGFVSRKGLTVGFVGASDRTGQYNNYQPYLNAGYNKAGFADLNRFNVEEQISSAQSADLIVFQMHSGREYSTEPRKSDTEWGDEFYDADFLAPAKSDILLRRHAIDAGADAVICHHPHIVQGVEVYKGKLIAHSLGNFVFDMGYAETFPSLVLKGYANENGFYKYEITPIYIDGSIPRRARGELGLYWLDALAEMSRKLNAYVFVERDSVKAEVILDTAEINPKRFRLEQTVDFTERNGIYYSQPMKIEKMGSVTKIISVGRNSEFEFRLGREKLWFGNMENEGANGWEINHPDEFYDETQFAFGERSICQRRPSGRLPLNTNLLRRIKIYNPEREFTLHSFVKTRNAKNAGVQIMVYDSRYSDYSLAVYNLGEEISGNSEWQEYFGDFEIPENGKFFNVRLRSEAPASGTGKAWFDNTGVIEWEDWQSAAASNEFAFPNDYYWIQIRKSSASATETVIYEETVLKGDVVSVEDNGGEEIPRKFRLYQNYPNPFNPITTIKYVIPNIAGVETLFAESGGHATSIRIYNILGEEIATLVNEKQPPGNYSVKFDASGLASGVYIYRLNVNGLTASKKMILLK